MDTDYIKDYETVLEGYDKNIIENKDSVTYEFTSVNGKVVSNKCEK